MSISTFQVENYKSFKSSGEIRFTAGFNVIVGRNNAGKSALIEALSLQFTERPHRSPQTAPRRSTQVDPHATCKITFTIHPEQAQTGLLEIGTFQIPTPPNRAAATLETFESLISGGLQLSTIWRQGGFQQASFVGFDAGATGHVSAVRWDPIARKLVKPEVTPVNVHSIGQLAIHLASRARERLYVFRAERFNIAECAVNPSHILMPNAQNLPDVLHSLQTTNPPRFTRYLRTVQQVFADIHQITITPVSNATVRINIWFVDPEAERADLAVPLSDCGTGISQVLAILYVVLTSDVPQTIVVDEPQSFLH